MQSAWTTVPASSYFTPPHPSQIAPQMSGNLPATSRPRVGLGVICMCIPQRYAGVQVLLLKRGPKFVSPLKWSFPGGRLDDEVDGSDEDGERGTMRELLKECGGGAPNGLPPLIHIECYKSGRTLYHVYVLDAEGQTTWFQWQPAKNFDHTGEIDLSARELTLQGKSFPSFNGFCWVDLQALIEECLAININDADAISSNQLQHGLIRWVRTNGENILKTLLARSPNLAYRRLLYPLSSPVRGAIGGVSSGNRLQLPRWIGDIPRPPLLSAYYPPPAMIPGQTTGTNEYSLDMLPPGGGGASNDNGTQPPTNDETGVTNATGSYEQMTGNALLPPPTLPLPIIDQTLVSTTHTYENGSSRKPHPRRYEICRYYLTGGVCPFGDKCWFLHPDSKDLTGLGTPPMSPLQHVWHPAALIDQSAMASTGPVASTGPISPTAWRFSGRYLPMSLRPTFPPPHPPPQGNTSNTVAAASLFRTPYPMFPNRFFPPPPPPHLSGYPQAHMVGGQISHSISDPVLRFKLLSELSLSDENIESSRLAVRADHFYLSLDQGLRDYRILFGGGRSYNDSTCLMVEQSFSHKVTCLHSSKSQSLLVLVGLENGAIYCWDPRKNGANSTISSLTVVHEPTTPESPVTALVHFNTTIDGAQVVASGHSNGSVSWYIAQPPMKIYSLLSSISYHAPHKVTSLQIFGGCLLSGSVNGTVCLWNMRSQEPTLSDTFQAHTKELLDIYILLDASSFLTVGLNSAVTDLAMGDLAEATPTTAVPPTSAESLAANLAKVSLSSSPNHYSASIWDYDKSVTNSKTVDNLGEILVSAFHQQPLFGNQFLAVGYKGGAIKIFNVPNFTVASEIHFPDTSPTGYCCHVAINLSRDKENTHHFNMRNPFRDLILSTVWSDGRIMICQIEPNYRSNNNNNNNNNFG